MSEPANKNTGGTSATLSEQLILNATQIRNKIGNLSQTNYYYVQFSLSDNLKKHFQNNYPNDISLGNINSFVSERLGYLCSEATLPVSSYATAEVKDNFIGVTQEFAHTRLYTDMDLTFYVDSDYTVLRFFEGWMDFIGGGNRDPEPAAATSYNTNVYRRFSWPNDYKSQSLYVLKFERDFKTKLVYRFINAFPKGLTAVPVSYGSAEILKVTATFNFDRYIVNREDIGERIKNEVTRAINEYNKGIPDNDADVYYELPGGGIGVRNSAFKPRDK